MTRFLNFIDDGLGRVFRRIKASTWVSTEQLACFRVCFGGLMLLYFLPSWSWLSDVPPGFFNPYILSFAYLTDNYLPEILYMTLDVAVILLLLCITLGIYSRLSFLLLYVLSAILYSYTFSFGKIDHFTTLFLFAYPVLAFTNAGTQFALVKDKPVSERTQSTALMVLGVIITFGLFNAGFSKCLDWIDFNTETSGFLSWLYYVYFNSEHHYLLVPYLFKVPSYLFEPLDYMASIFEVAGIFFLLKGRRYWHFFLLIASVFHFLNLLGLNLSFAMNSLLYGIFFTAPVVFHVYKKNEDFFRRWRIYFMVGFIAIALARILMVLTGNIIYNYHNTLSWVQFEHAIDMMIWLLTIGAGVYYLRRKQPAIAL